jgi:uncharacterized protein (DUF697 family)
MSAPNGHGSPFDSLNEAIATATKLTTDIFEVATGTISDAVTAASKTVGSSLYRLVEDSTEMVGQLVTPIAENPVVQFATKVPGLKWLMAALGQVNVEQVQREVATLQQKYPSETSEQLAHRMIVDTAMKAGGVGLITTIVPPLAITLFAIDLAAVTALQAEMVYHIATIYGFSPTDPTRRGEAIAIWGLATGGSGLVRTGLSIFEIIPGVGTVIGATTNAAVVYALGHAANQYYVEKLRSSQETESERSVDG